MRRSRGEPLGTEEATVKARGAPGFKEQEGLVWPQQRGGERSRG